MILWALILSFAMANLPSFTAEELGTLHDEMWADSSFFAETTLKIATKDDDAEIKPLRFTTLQQRASDIYDRINVHNVPARIINLKARQVKMTTLWTSLAYKLHLYAKGPRVTTLIGNKYDVTTLMVRMVERYIDNMPWWWKPKIDLKSEFRLARSGARILQETAQYMRAGQGSTSHTVIATEVPYFDHPDVFVALLGSVPKKPGTFVVLEGTANRTDPTFHPRWKRAEAHVRELCAVYGARDQYDLLFNISGWGNEPDFRGEKHPNGYWDGTYYPLFFAWYEEPEYVWDPRLVGLSDDTLTDEEKIEKKRYDLTFEQLAWRRYQISEEFNGDTSKFKQEYPGNPDEAFQMSGSPVFAPEIVYEYKEKTEAFASKLAHVELRWDPSEKGRFSPRFDSSGKVVVNIDQLRVKSYLPPPYNTLRYKKPRYGVWENRYCMGIDVCTGLAAGKGDWSVAWVKDRVRQEYVAMYRGRMEPEDLADYVARLGTYYENAWILFELNGPGLALKRPLERLYSRLLHGIKFVSGKEVLNDHAGMLTTGSSKEVLISKVQELVKRSPASMPFNQFWVEGSTFVYYDPIGMGAESKKQNPGVENYDDSILACAYTEMADELAPPLVDLRKKTEVDEQGEYDDGRGVLTLMPGYAG